MGKYLHDIRTEVSLKKGEKEFTTEKTITLDYFHFVGELYNYFLPRKIEIGSGIWRICIKLTDDPNYQGKLEEVGLVINSYLLYDFQTFVNLSHHDKMEEMLKLLSLGIKQVCNQQKIADKIFEDVADKVRSVNFEFEVFYKSKKKSPNRLLTAQIKGKIGLIHTQNQVMIYIWNKAKEIINQININNYDFRYFDRLEWVNDHIIHLYETNHSVARHSRTGKENYFQIDIKTLSVTYQPVLKSSIFHYGMKLFEAGEDMEKAMYYIQKAEEMGHGKAKNVLFHLAKNPEEKDVNVLMQNLTKKEKNDLPTSESL